MSLISLTQLQETATGIAMQESVDRASLFPFTSPDLSSLTPKLLEWTSLGFPNTFNLVSITIIPLPICSDGVSRSFYDYVSYLIGIDISAQTQLFQQNFVDITCGYTIDGNTLGICISKGLGYNTDALQATIFPTFLPDTPLFADVDLL